VPLDIFLECCFDKDYDRLVITGEATEDEKLQAWEKIYVEYANLLTEGDGNDLYNKTIEINYLSTKLFIVNKIVKHLSISFNTELLDILKYYGVDNRISENDSNDQRCKKLEIVIKLCKRWNTELDLLHKEFEALQAEHSDKKGGRETFEDSLTNISVYRKYSVIDRDITVRQFLKSIKAMEQQAIKLATKNT